MTQKRQHDAKTSKGAQRETRDTSKAADTGSAAAKTPPKQQPEGQKKKG